jgi:hypothetical protein
MSLSHDGRISQTDNPHIVALLCGSFDIATRRNVENGPTQERDI